MDLSFDGSHQYAAVRYYGDYRQSVKHDVQKSPCRSPVSRPRYERLLGR